MPNPREVTRTEQRLAEVDALRQTIQQLKGELAAYGEALREELEWLRQEQAGEEEEAGQEEEATEPVESHEVIESEAVETEEEASEEPYEPEEEPAPPARPAHAATPQRMARPAPRVPVPPPAEDEELPDMVEPSARGGKPVSVLISHGEDDSEPISGWILERPSGGLRILVDEQIPIGSVLSIRPTKEHPHSQWVNISVKSCRPERNSFLLGCSFVERPPWTVLALFAG